MNDIAMEYSAGLFELASDEGQEESLLGEIKVLKPLFTREYLHTLINPSIPKSARCAMIDEAFGGRVSKNLVSFMKLMVDRGIADLIPACFAEYENLYREKFNITVVTAESAVELSDSQKERLVSKLEEKTGGKVEMVYRVNPTLLGGMKLDIGNRRIDDSVKAKIDEIAARLKA